MWVTLLNEQIVKPNMGFLWAKSGSSCCNSANTDRSFLFFSFWINKLMLCYFMKSLGALDLYYVWNI